MTLRRLAVSDLTDFQAYRHDPEVGRWQGWTPQTDEQARAFLAEMADCPPFQAGRWTQFGIADDLTGRLVGDLGIHVSQDGREAEFGFSLARSAQGRGLASSAIRSAIALVFDQTAVSHIQAQTDARNTACLRLLERLGATRLAALSTEFRGEPCVELRFELARRPG